MEFSGLSGFYTMAAVRIHEVSKTFGKVTAVDHLSLEVAPGSIYGFIGPNGSGKTTTLRMILGILEPEQGRIEVLGEARPRAANDRVGYLPEERGLYKKMTVRRGLAYFAGLKGLTGRPAKKRIADWLERMDLTEWADRKVETLSKGMAQKIQFISTVVTRPELVILDEPFSGLDPVNLEVIREAILELRGAGSTVIFSTHDMSKAEEMCDVLCMIFRGKKVLDGTLDAISEEYGADVLRVRVADPRVVLALDGVDVLRDLGRMQELRCPEDPQALLRSLIDRTKVLQFEIAHPSLHDIFLRIAGPQASEAAA